MGKLKDSTAQYRRLSDSSVIPNMIYCHRVTCKSLSA
jgi:hypothetical protein